MTTMHKPLCLLLLSLIATSFTGCVSKKKQIDWIKVQEQSHSESITISGQLQPSTLTPINSPVDGSISKIISSINQHVAKNALILEISAPDALDQLRQELNELRKNQRQFAKKQQAFEHAKELYEKYKGVSRNEVDDLADEVTSLHETVQSNYNSVYKSAGLFGLNSTEIDQINPSDLYAKTYPVLITAPASGELVEQSKNSITYSTGQTVKKHDLLALITDQGNYVVSNVVNEDDARLLKVGMSAIVTSKDTKNPLNGIITSIKPQHGTDHSQSGIQNYLVTISVKPTGEEQLSMGLTVKAAIKIDHPKSLSIPISSVCIEGSDTYVITPGNPRQAIVLGQSVGQNIHVQHGLLVGDKIAQQCHDSVS